MSTRTGRPRHPGHEALDALIAGHPGLSHVGVARLFAAATGLAVDACTVARRRRQLAEPPRKAAPARPPRGWPDLSPEAVRHRADVLRRWAQRRARLAAPRARLRWERVED